MGAFEYRQAQEIRDVFLRHNIKYLFIGKSGAILLGFPDTTQDADLYVEKNPANCENLVQALQDLGFQIMEQQAREIRRGKDFIVARERRWGCPGAHKAEPYATAIRLRSFRVIRRLRGGS